MQQLQRVRRAPAAQLCPLLLHLFSPGTADVPKPRQEENRAAGGALILSISPSRASLPLPHPTATKTHLLPSPASYWEIARGSLQSCYIARCSLTFPTRLLCAKYLTPTGSLKAFGSAMATRAQREQSAIYTTLISNDLPHFYPRLLCTAPGGQHGRVSPAARTRCCDPGGSAAELPPSACRTPILCFNKSSNLGFDGTP